jgi:hypothetical protein
MTASTGHKFVLRFYPRGHPNRKGNEDYASLMLHLHESSNDLDLEWPWDKQWFKFIVQDQVPDVLFRMDQNRVRAIQVGYGYDEDLSEEPLSEKWGKITDADENGVSEKASIGYETFIPAFDIFESSYSYIKHDTFMIFVDVRDLSKLDTSSKLSSCVAGPDDDGTKEQNRCPGMGRACMKVGKEYMCTCHYPFETKVVNGTEVCECPNGYNFNPTAEDAEAERLTCFSDCDFPETNPCKGDEICVQTESGSTCKATFETKSEQTRPLVRTAQSDSTPDEKTFSPFEFGISIAMTFFGTVLLGMLLYLIRSHRRAQKIKKLTSQPYSMNYIQRIPPRSYENKSYKEYDEAF